MADYAVGLGGQFNNVADALSQTTTDPHPTLILEDGFYTPFTVNRECTIKAKNKWRAVVVGPDVTRPATPGSGNWPVDSQHVVRIEKADKVTLSGLNVMGSAQNGVFIHKANSCTVENCWIHHNVRHGILAETNHIIVRRNLIECNGSSRRFHYGLYLLGYSIPKTPIDKRACQFIVDYNVIRQNSALGAKLRPAEKKNQPAEDNWFIQNLRFRGNIINGNGYAGLWLRGTRDKNPNRNTIRRDNYLSFNTFARSEYHVLLGENSTHPHHESAINNIFWNGLVFAEVESTKEDDALQATLVKGNPNITTTHQGRESNLHANEDVFADDYGDWYWLVKDVPGALTQDLSDVDKTKRPPDEDFWGKSWDELHNKDKPGNYGAAPWISGDWKKVYPSNRQPGVDDISSPDNTWFLPPDFWSLP